MDAGSFFLGPCFYAQVLKVKANFNNRSSADFLCSFSIGNYDFLVIFFFLVDTLSMMGQRRLKQ